MLGEISYMSSEGVRASDFVQFQEFWRVTDLMSTFSTTAMEVEQTMFTKMETVFILRVLGSSLGSFPISETTYPGRCPYSRSLQEDLEILVRPLINKPRPFKGLNIRIPIIIPGTKQCFAIKTMAFGCLRAAA